MNKYLIAYFSRKGENYVNGQILDLPVGNTEVAAKEIQNLTGGDLFCHQPAKGICGKLSQMCSRGQGRAAKRGPSGDIGLCSKLGRL